MGNTIQAMTKGVTAFTLLLSSDKFDFNQPIKVVANGRTVFEGRVERNLNTLLNGRPATTTGRCFTRRNSRSSCNLIRGRLP